MLSALALPAAIGAGWLAAHVWPSVGAWASDGQDGTVLALVFLLLLDMRLAGPRRWRAAAADLPFLALAVGANFVLVPMIGLGVAWLFMGAHPMLFVGLAIYFMAPCTDWFLGFTRLAGGNTTLGAALIPVNMTLQLLLYPFYVGWLAPVQAGVGPAFIGGMLLQWFLLPLVAALVLRLLLRRWLPERALAQVRAVAGKLVHGVLVLLVFEIFAAHGAAMGADLVLFALILAAAFVFFMLTFVMGELLAGWRGLPHEEKVLLSMTTAARNAPLMLAVSLAALPGQPQVCTAIVIGMLVEFPHLMLLRHLLSRQRGRGSEPEPEPAAVARILAR